VHEQSQKKCTITHPTQQGHLLTAFQYSTQLYARAITIIRTCHNNYTHVP